MFSYLTYGLIWLISCLPLWVLYFFSDILYVILYYIVRYRRRVVHENLLRSFPEKSEGERRRIGRKFYSNLCDTFIESYKPWHMSTKSMMRRCVFKRTEILQKYYDQGKSVIGVLGHYGNWEWMASYALWQPQDVDFFTLYKPMHNKIIDRMMVKIRSRFGAIPVPRDEVLRKIVRNRQDGRLFLAGFIADQTPNSNNLNFWMDFLNQDTPVLLGTEKIATKFNLPVISLHMRKLKRGYYEVEFVDLCEDPTCLPAGELTIRHMRVLEEQIRNAPEYWLWSHKRWKHER